MEGVPAPRKHSKMRSLQLNPYVGVAGAISIFFLSQVIATTLLYVYGTLRGWTEDEFFNWLDASSNAQFMAYVLTATLGIYGVRIVLKWCKKGWKDIGLIHPKAWDAVYAVVGYGLYLPLYIVSSVIIGVAFPSIDFQQEQQLGFSTSVAGFQLALVFVSLVVLPPLFEEILMRGLLFSGLRSRLKLWTAGLITSLLFAVAHLQWGSDAPLLWAAAIDTFVLSVVLVGLREKTGSLWPAIGLHAIKNLVAFSLLYIFKVV